MHGPVGKEKLEQMRRLKERLTRVTHKIVVMSGKGGVGKSTVTVNLALGLAQRGYKVGILDTDIHGPNIPHMLGIQETQMGGLETGMIPVEARPGLSVASLALVGHKIGTAYIWRGPLKIALIQQFLADVDWGNLDYLLVDSPPGTGDEPLTVLQTIFGSKGTVVVTTPQGVSVLDTRRSIDFAHQLNTPILGLIENMSGYFDPESGKTLPLFGTGGGQAAAQELGVKFLGALPMDPRVPTAAEAGHPFMELESSPVKDAFEKVLDQITAQMPVEK